MDPKPACCHRTRERTPEEYRSLVHRLNRIEGQVRGIRGMLEKDAYCPDILAQAAAANAALNAFSREMCIRDRGYIRVRTEAQRKAPCLSLCQERLCPGK